MKKAETATKNESPQEPSKVEIAYTVAADMIVCARKIESVSPIEALEFVWKANLMVLYATIEPFLKNRSFTGFLFVRPHKERLKTMKVPKEVSKRVEKIIANKDLLGMALNRIVPPCIDQILPGRNPISEYLSLKKESTELKKELNSLINSTLEFLPEKFHTQKQDFEGSNLHTATDFEEYLRPWKKDKKVGERIGDTERGDR